jgi:4-hydroxybenzoate polyprenyltransferase
MQIYNSSKKNKELFFSIVSLLFLAIFQYSIIFFINPKSINQYSFLNYLLFLFDFLLILFFLKKFLHLGFKLSNLFKNIINIFFVLIIILLTSIIFSFSINLNLFFPFLFFQKFLGAKIFLRILTLIFVSFNFILLYYWNRRYFFTLFRDIRPFRIFHFELMFTFGYLLYLRSVNSLGVLVAPEVISKFLLMSFSIFFASLFSLISNNFSDYQIDRISNRKRPLIQETIKKNDYFLIGVWSFFIAILCSLIVGLRSLIFILVFIGIYFIYSMKPLRLKKIFLFSKLLIALNSLILILAGFSLSVVDFNNFPSFLYYFILIGFTLVINFIDIKDEEGDRRAEIKTLPVLVGLENSKILIGLFFIFVYLSAYYLFKKIIIFFVLLFFSLLEFYFINKKEYNEKIVFVIYLISLIVIGLVFLYEF